MCRGAEIPKEILDEVNKPSPTMDAFRQQMSDIESSAWERGFKVGREVKEKNGEITVTEVWLADPITGGATLVAILANGYPIRDKMDENAQVEVHTFSHDYYVKRFLEEPPRRLFNLFTK